MAISYISSATGTNTATLGTHTTGDLILVFAYRDGNTGAPTLPAGFTNIQGSGSNTNSARMGWKIAASGSETVGTWTNATSVIASVYRGTDGVGGSAITGGASATVTFPAVTMSVTDGTSWVVGAVGHRSTNVAIETVPSGMTNRTSVSDATDEAALHDTNGGVTSFTSRTAALGGTSSGFRSISVELLAATAPTLTGQTVATTIDTGTPSVVTNKASGTVYAVIVPNGDTPSVAQIKAGQQSSGAGAINAQSQSVTVSGLQTFSTATGLTPLTDYDAWFVHANDIGDSTAVKADFVTRYSLIGTFNSFSTVADGGLYPWVSPNNAATSNNSRTTSGNTLTWGGSTAGTVETTDLLRSGAVNSWTGGGAPAGTIYSVTVVVEGFFNSPGVTTEELSVIGMFKDSTATRLTMNPAVSVTGTVDVVNNVLFTGGALTADDLNSANFYCDVKFSAVAAVTASGFPGAHIDQVYIIVESDDVIAPAAQTSSTLYWAFP